MTKEEFYDIVEKLIVPLFTGSYLAGEENSTPRDLEVALGKGSSILLKPSKMDEYRLVLKRGQAFKSFEVGLIKEIINEMNLISQSNFEDQTYVEKMRDLAVEKALVDSIASSASSTILGIINGMEKWSARTYEGAEVNLGVMINLSEHADDDSSVHYSSILANDFISLFTDGMTSFMEFDASGYLLGYVNLKNPRSVATISPYRYERGARVCNDRRVGLVLTKRGDILVFYERQLVFAKRNGNWCVFSHDEIVRLLQNNVSYTAKIIRKAIYNTALDCSFAYNGACIVYLNNDQTENALMRINAKDIVTEEHFEIKKQLELEEAGKLYNIANSKELIDQYSVSYQEFLDKNKLSKTKTLRKIIAGKKLFELDRKFIEEMMSIDGATIIDHDGTIIAVGAIVKIDAGSEGGGRLAAAKTMARYGVAIKVSQDGILEGFTLDKKKNVVRQIFYMG